MEEILNYIKVNDNISTSGQPTKEQFEKIAKDGFDVVINLATHHLSKGALKDEGYIVSKNKMDYIHLPVSWENPEIDKLKLFLILLETLLKENKKIFIHCIKNYRVSVFIYKYKQYILGEKDTVLIAPKDYKPSKKWEELIDMRLK